MLSFEKCTNIIIFHWLVLLQYEGDSYEGDSLNYPILVQIYKFSHFLARENTPFR